MVIPLLNKIRRHFQAAFSNNKRCLSIKRILSHIEILYCIYSHINLICHMSLGTLQI